ncbi:MAG: class IV adenylate cyclase [Candidatus Omnitrophica bacterium]|nr:class IV adenylate cyclase [Candidatus Omnitrophota bacterium]
MKNFEIEKKYKLKDPQGIRRLLRKLGAQKKKSGREENQFWDLEGRLETRKTTLRLRRHGSSSLLTVKGPRQAQKHHIDKRLEIEMPVDFKVTTAMLKALGFKLWLKYVKTRELYQLGRTLITMDNLGKYGWFLEIEGSVRDILAVEKKIGLDSRDAEARSYLAIILKKNRF